MILSASRRTDIPAFYADWFINRIKEGYLYVRNPMNIHQISKIPLTPELVDIIVFWTKNPIPLMDKLDMLKDYMYYFQFTITGYDKDLEPGLPDKDAVLIPTFKKLSEMIGKERVIWRYDPIMFSDKYSPEFHLKRFDEMSKQLAGYTDKCVISFVDIYAKNKANMAKSNSYEIEQEKLEEFAKSLADMAHANNMDMATCAEIVDLEKCGISHNHCIDKELIEKLIGYEIMVGKDKVQRQECGCIESVEIGTYNTCKHGCTYCYANYSKESVIANCHLYDPNSALLCSNPITELDKITDRKVKSIKGDAIGGPKQMSLFDFMSESTDETN